MQCQAGSRPSLRDCSKLDSKVSDVGKLRAAIGDVVEIITSNGFAYAQLTHRHTAPPKYGDLIRVLNGIFDERPKDIDVVVSGDDQFRTFVPLNAMLKLPEFNVVGNYEVPEHCQPFPLFRAGNRSPKTKRVAVWWLWDGEREWRVNDLEPGQELLPIRQLITPPILIDRIETGWRSENWL